MSRKNPNRQGFLNRVDDIRLMESDIDKLLAAARLQRIESGRAIGSIGSLILKLVSILGISTVASFVIYFDLTSNARGAGMLSFLFGAAAVGVIAMIALYKGES